MTIRGVLETRVNRQYSHEFQTVSSENGNATFDAIIESGVDVSFKHTRATRGLAVDLQERYPVQRENIFIPELELKALKTLDKVGERIVNSSLDAIDPKRLK